MITIVDAGNLNRTELGEQLKIISECSPRIVALDYFLVPDSGAIDKNLIEAFSRLNNTVQCVAVHSNTVHKDIWDTLETSHPKFTPNFRGYSNISITDDSVIIPELPIKQFYRDDLIYSFSYVVAANSFGINSKYKSYVDETFGFEFRDMEFDIEEFAHKFKIISAPDLMSRNFSLSDLQNKIVVVGYIGNSEDDFYLNKERKRKINGVEIQANFIRLLLNRP